MLWLGIAVPKDEGMDLNFGGTSQNGKEMCIKGNMGKETIQWLIHVQKHLNQCISVTGEMMATWIETGKLNRVTSFESKNYEHNLRKVEFEEITGHVV